MTDNLEQITTAINTLNQAAFTVSLFGYNINLIAVTVVILIVAMLALFWKIQHSEKLDFTDMFTKDGRKVSLTKVLQFISGIASTWIIVKTGLQGTLSAELFGIYLTYMGSIEGFSKFMAAKYGYSETSIKDAGNKVTE